MKTWYCLTSRPQREAQAKAWLERRGAEAWYPVEAYMKAIPRSRKGHVEAERRIAPGYVFAAWQEAPKWHLILGTMYLRGVVCVAGEPARIPEAAMMEMRQVPQRLMAVRERQRIARTIRKGDRVRVKAGPISSVGLDVRDVSSGIAKCISPLFGGRELEVKETDLIKIGSDSSAYAP